MSYPARAEGLVNRIIIILCAEVWGLRLLCIHIYIFVKFCFCFLGLFCFLFFFLFLFFCCYCFSFFFCTRCYRIGIILHRSILPISGAIKRIASPIQNRPRGNGNEWDTPLSSDFRNWSLTIKCSIYVGLFILQNKQNSGNNIFHRIKWN